MLTGNSRLPCRRLERLTCSPAFPILAILTPCFLKAIHGLSGGGELFRSARRIGSGSLLQLEHQRETGLWPRLQEFDRCGPLNRAVKRRKVLVFVAVIVVEMRGGNEIAQG